MLKRYTRRVKGIFKKAKVEKEEKKKLGDKQKQFDEGYISDVCTDDYSEEASSESESEIDDGAEIVSLPCQVGGKWVGVFECLNDVSSESETEEEPKFFTTGLPDSKDEEETTESQGVNTLEGFFLSKPPADTWKESWPKKAKTTESACVNVYSFFEHGTCCGGYAVILRNMSAQPIAARTKFSMAGGSYLFQVLDGLLDGLHLASEHGCSSPYVRCNSRIIVSLLSLIASATCNCKCKWKIGKICQKCANIVPYMSDNCFQNLVPQIRTLSKKIDCTKFACASREMNGAAHYLANEAKKRAVSDVRMLFKTTSQDCRNFHCSVDLKPNEFTEELVSILLDDAYDSVSYNWDAKGKLGCKDKQG